MKENMVKLSEVLEYANGFIDGRYTQEDLDNWCSKIIFTLSTTTREKYMIIYTIIHELEYSEDTYERFIELEMNKFWYGLLFYTNIDISEKELLTEENYDILNQFLTTWILGYVKNDYDVFLNMFDKVWNYNILMFNTETLIESLSELNKEGLARDEDLLGYIKENPNTIEDLAQIAVMGSQFVIPKQKDKKEK